MASMALVRALSVDPQIAVRPHRVLSASLIDKMKTIPEDQLLCPSPSPTRRVGRQSFAYGSTSEQFGYSPRSFPSGLDSSTERVKLLVHNEEEDVQDCCDAKTCHHILVSFLALMTVLSMVAQIVSIPLYIDSMSDRDSGSDAFIASFIAAMWQPVIFFVVIFFFIYIQNPRNGSVFLPNVPWSNVAVAGILGGLSTMLVAFTSLPNRTLPEIQAILQQLSVPCTVFTRFVVLRKGINIKQAVCLFTLGIGIFITLEPAIFGISEFRSRISRDEPNPHAWYYYVIYGFSQLPLAFSYALMEQGQKRTEVETIAYAAWYQFFLLLSYILFVWIDFIPGFGMATSPPTDFIDKLSNGFQCFYAVDKSCANVAPLAVTYTLSTAGTTLFSILLIRYAEGALFTVIIMTFATPLTTLFWTLFTAQPTLHWAPAINISTGFLLVGLVIMMPSVVMYAYFREDPYNMEPTEEEEKKTREAEMAEKRRLLQERARRARKQRRRYTVTYNGRNIPRRNSQTEYLQRASGGGKSNPKPLHRVRSAPVMFGGF